MTALADASPPEDTLSPKWVRVWLALLAPMYFLSPLALLGLRGLKSLPPLSLWVLGIYAISQQLPALFSPEPLLASVLALIRTALVLGLIGLGALLGSALKVRPFGLGLLMVFVTAIATNLFNQVDFFVYRLNHPYMTSVTLGLAGALAIWLSLFMAGRWQWRVPFAVLGLLILLFSGSRGPLLACSIGVLLGIITLRRKRYFVMLALGLLMVVGGVVIGSRDTMQALSRFAQIDVSGREVVWRNTLSVIHSEPLSGVGSYRLGTYLSEPGRCLLFDVNTSQQTQATCPTWLTKLGQPWLIAHNGALQQMAETGPLGVAGLFLLLGLVVTATFVRSSPEPIAVAVVTGLLVSNITDNTLLVPSPFYAEIFWIIAGTQLVSLKTRNIAIPFALGTFTSSLLLAIPLIFMAESNKQPERTQVQSLFAPQIVTSLENYPVFVKFNLPPGNYMVALNSCSLTCRPLRSSTFSTTTGESPMIQWMIPSLSAAKSQQLELLIYTQPARSLQPFGIYRWEVSWKP